jgi:hypothetical protein
MRAQRTFSQRQSHKQVGTLRKSDSLVTENAAINCILMTPFVKLCHPTLFQIHNVALLYIIRYMVSLLNFKV